MDGFTLNKIAGSVLSSLLVIFGSGVLIDELYPTGRPSEGGKEIQVVAVTPENEKAPASQGSAGGASEPAKPLNELLASAKPEEGQAVAKKCASCHSFTKDGKNGVGPHLWGVVGRPIGSVSDFSYSPAVKGHGGNWDFEALNHWLEDPKAFIPGNKMAFPGLKKPEDRAAVISYLRTLSDNPAPLPTASAEQPK